MISFGSRDQNLFGDKLLFFVLCRTEEGETSLRFEVVVLGFIRVKDVRNGRANIVNVASRCGSFANAREFRSTREIYTLSFFMSLFFLSLSPSSEMEQLR